MNKNLHALVLAAGKGTRFRSDQIKVLHTLLGKSMLQLVLESIGKLRPEKTHLVVGYKKETIMAEPYTQNIHFIVQEEQLGTAHAVLSARSALRFESEKDLLVMNGDLPLIKPETLKPFVRFHQKSGNAMTFMTAEPANPYGFGRVIKIEPGGFLVIEEKDATPEQRKLREVNVGIYLFKIKDLFQTLPKISNKNRKGEYYLTDIVEVMSRAGKRVGKYKSDSIEEVIGVNDRAELALAVDALRRRKIDSLSNRGVTFLDPNTTWIDFDVRIGKDTVIYPSVFIEGNSSIGKDCKLFPFVHILDSRIGSRTHVLTSTVIEGSTLGEDVRIGPFAHLRPKSILKNGSKVGNFVEMKNTVFGKGAKAGHLSYLGDALIEQDVNIGAGTICCNYDGLKKSRTTIDKGAFIGSGVELVAPVKVGKGAYVGAGSTITKDVSPDALAVERGRQIEKKGWARRKRKK